MSYALSQILFKFNAILKSIDRKCFSGAREVHMGPSRMYVDSQEISQTVEIATDLFAMFSKPNICAKKRARLADLYNPM